MEKRIVIRSRGIIVDQGELLVVKHVHGSVHYALPGGHLEWGEDPETCLTRELIEELGITPQVGRLLYINTFTQAEAHSVEFFYEVLNGAEYRAPIASSHTHEIEEIAWVSPGQTDIVPPKIADDFWNGELQHDIPRLIR